MHNENKFVLTAHFPPTGKSNASLVEIGPYTYLQIMKKVNISFSKDGSEVSYAVQRVYSFSAEHSRGSESDVIVMPNIPLFGAMKKLKR